MFRLHPVHFCFLLISLLAGLPVQGQSRFRPLAERTSVEVEAEQHRVMAFYYPWYRMPDSEEEQPTHWEDINRDHFTLSNSENYPLLGPYDSNDPELIRQHMRWAKEHRIDTYIVSWWGHGHYSEQPVPALLDAAEEHGRNITVYYENVPGSGEKKNAASATRDISKLLNKYADHPAWLRVNGRPVLFVYGRAVGQISLQSWARVQRKLRKKFSPAPLLIGDQFSSTSALVFDGVHTYNPVNSMIGKDPGQVGSWARNAYTNWIDMAERTGRISTLTLIPSYNDTKIREPGKRVPRYGGELYERQWEQAVKRNPDWVLITSFNEWHEGSDIEPSVEYGHRYLDLTDRYAKSFTSRPVRKDPITEGPIGQEELADLRRKMDGMKVGILPRPSSAVFPWLFSRLRIEPRFVGWKRLVEDPPDPDEVPILIYAADEQYRQTVNEEGDVNEALRRYMKDGGLLMVCPSGPVPFYSNMNGEPVPGFRTFGLPLEIGGKEGVRGWETPPENEQLTFVQPDERLTHVPFSFAFPGTGDLRWRPFNPGRLSKNDVHVPLLKLRNQDGEYLGDAVAYAELNGTGPEGGKLLYCWYRLLRMKQAEPLMYDLFAFAVGQVR